MAYFKWIAWALILLLVFAAGLCSRTEPTKEDTKQLEQIQAINAEKIKAIAEKEIILNMLKDCNSAYDTILVQLEKKRPDIKKKYETITRKPLTDSELQREIAELYRQSAK